jgi:hypothetical protein
VGLFTKAYITLASEENTLAYFVAEERKEEKSFELTPREQEGKFKCCAAK